MGRRATSRATVSRVAMEGTREVMGKGRVAGMVGRTILRRRTRLGDDASQDARYEMQLSTKEIDIQIGLVWLA